MPELALFRCASGARQVLTKGMNGEIVGIHSAALPRLQRAYCRVVEREEFCGTSGQCWENVEFKSEFYKALVSEAGPHIADTACFKVGLPENWRSALTPLSGKKVRRILTAFDEIRTTNLGQASARLTTFLKTDGPHLLGLCPTSVPGAFSYPHFRGISYLHQGELSDPLMQQVMCKELHNNYRFSTTGDIPLRRLAPAIIIKFWVEKVRHLAPNVAALRAILPKDLAHYIGAMMAFLPLKRRPAGRSGG